MTVQGQLMLLPQRASCAQERRTMRKTFLSKQSNIIINSRKNIDAGFLCVVVGEGGRGTAASDCTQREF